MTKQASRSLWILLVVLVTSCDVTPGQSSEMVTTRYLEESRAGARPRTTPTAPHMQLEQNASPALQERVYVFARGLEGVVVGPSAVSGASARAFHLPSCAHPKHDSFMVEREVAHMHSASDGSLHMVLPPNVVDRVIANGWAERHPLAGKRGMPMNVVMVFGPRDEDELAVVQDLVRAAHAYACG